MWQMQWLEMMKDSDLTISYYPGKANVVVGMHSKKSFSNMATLITPQKLLLEDMRRMELLVVLPNTSVNIENMVMRPTLLDRIKVAQEGDSYLQKS